METFNIDRSRYDDAVQIDHEFIAEPGLSEELVRLISKHKNEPDWMLAKRLQGLKLFSQTKLPTWGPDLSQLDLDKIVYYVSSGVKETKRWEELPEEIRKTAERIGIPKAEREALGGAGFQMDSSMAYHNLKKELEEQGVIFENMDVAVQKYPELVKKYFMTSCIPVNDHKFIMLHAAVWSGGTFIYIPKGIKVKTPLQAYFRMNALQGGQFEHTLIIADEDSELSYIEGCSSPLYSSGSLHAGCVEIHVLKGARARYSSVENWSKNVYNLNTKRALVHEDGIIEWVNGNNGCLAGDTLVLTNPEGPIKISEIEPGQKIYSLDLNTLQPIKTKVKATKSSGFKDVYEIVTDNSREVRATKNHPFLTLNKNKSYLSWESLENIRPGDYICTLNILPDDGEPYSLPEIKEIGKNRIDILEKTTEDLMWILGVYLGDGFIEKVNQSRNSKIKVSRRVYFAVPESDKIREKLDSKLKEIFKTKLTYKGICVTINSIMLCQLIEKLELMGNAKTKRIPKWVFSLPHSQKLAFIEGYLDSDGYVRKNHNRKTFEVGGTFTSCNKQLLHDFKLLMITCGLNPYKLLVYKRKRLSPTAKGGREYINYSFNINKKDVFMIRKHKSYFGNNVIFSRVKYIKHLGKEKTYDIEIDGPPNFIANGVVVHNSQITMLYPSSVLVGDGAKSDFLGIALAGKGQNQDTGSKVIHAAPNTSSRIVSKSISKDGGISTYRGLVVVNKKAINSKVHVQCDALLMDRYSKSNTYPTMRIENNEVEIAHEASVGKVGEEQLFYLMTRGLTEEQALQMVVSGFIEPIVKALPLEYAIELNKLIEYEMEGAVG